jgi:DHA1 family tetracycline resistance protein-like MFS transporter
MRKPSLLIIFLTVFIDLVGFGIVIPLTPIFSKHFGAHGLTIGLITASFSVMQFIFSPIWGRISDRIGRRPVLLISTAGAAVSYVLFAIGCGMEDKILGIWMLVISRSFAGICGGNITVAQAYIADITPPENRSKRMGLIGMAFGFGFIFGPVIGGLSLNYFGLTGPGWAAAILCAINFILALFILVESWKPSADHAPYRPRFAQWAHTLSNPRIAVLIFVFFLSTFCFSAFENTIGLLVAHNFNLSLGDRDASVGTITYLFAYCGIISAVVQGGMIGKLVKKWGEPKLIALSLVITGLSLAAIPFLRGNGELSWGVLLKPEGVPWIWLLLALAALAIGSGLTRPPLFGMLSNLAPANEQGVTIGVAQSMGSLARILGPIYANTTLEYAPAATYLICTVILIIAAFVVFQRLYHPN